jgi:hypothetical protein
MELSATINIPDFLNVLQLRDVYALMLACKLYYTELTDHTVLTVKANRRKARIQRLYQVQKFFTVCYPPLAKLTYLASYRLTFQFNFVLRCIIPRLARGELLIIIYDDTRQYPGESIIDVNVAVRHMVSAAQAASILLAHYPHMGPDSGDALMKHMSQSPHLRRVLALLGPHDMANCGEPYCVQGQEAFLKPHSSITNLYQYRSARVDKPQYIPEVQSNQQLVVQKPTYENMDVDSTIRKLRSMSGSISSKDKFAQFMALMFDGDGLWFEKPYTRPSLIRARNVNAFI